MENLRMKNWNKDSRAIEIHNLLDVKSRVELREWLIKNHKTEKVIATL